VNRVYAHGGVGFKVEELVSEGGNPGGLEMGWTAGLFIRG